MVARILLLYALISSAAWAGFAGAEVSWLFPVESENGHVVSFSVYRPTGITGVLWQSGLYGQVIKAEEAGGNDRLFGADAGVLLVPRSYWLRPGIAFGAALARNVEDGWHWTPLYRAVLQVSLFSLSAGSGFLGLGLNFSFF